MPVCLSLLCQVSSELHDLTKSRALWSSLVRRYVLNQSLPIPRLHGKSLDQLSALKLEQCLRRALRLRRNWVSPLPAVINRFTLPGMIPRTRIVSMHLVSEHGTALLLSLSMQTHPTRKFTLHCWDLEVQPVVCLASYECKKFRGLAVNKESRNGARIVAILNPQSVEYTDHLKCQTNGQNVVCTFSRLTDSHLRHALAASLPRPFF